MVQTCIGGFLFLSGTIGLSIQLAAASAYPLNSWVTPPGRMICALLESGLWVASIGFFLVLLVGAVLLWRTYHGERRNG